jgi:hypothetical protein
MLRLVVMELKRMSEYLTCGQDSRWNPKQVDHSCGTACAGHSSTVHRARGGVQADGAPLGWLAGPAMQVLSAGRLLVVLGTEPFSKFMSANGVLTRVLENVPIRIVYVSLRMRLVVFLEFGVFASLPQPRCLRFN